MGVIRSYNFHTISLKATSVLFFDRVRGMKHECAIAWLRNIPLLAVHSTLPYPAPPSTRYLPQPGTRLHSLPWSTYAHTLTCTCVHRLLTIMIRFNIVVWLYTHRLDVLHRSIEWSPLESDVCICMHSMLASELRAAVDPEVPG